MGLISGDLSVIERTTFLSSAALFCLPFLLVLSQFSIVSLAACSEGANAINKTADGENDATHAFQDSIRHLDVLMGILMLLRQKPDTPPLKPHPF